MLRTPSPRSAAAPPSCRDKRPITSVSCHPHPARWGPSELPPSAGPGSRPGPPCGTCHSWRRVNPPCSIPFRFNNTATTTIVVVVVMWRLRPIRPAVPRQPVAPDQWRSCGQSGGIQGRRDEKRTVCVTVLPVAEVGQHRPGTLVWSSNDKSP